MALRGIIRIQPERPEQKNREQKILHIIEKQATVLNESLWEIRTNTKLIGELQGQINTLQHVTTRLLTQTNIQFNYFEYFTHLDTTFDTISNVLIWLHQLTDNLDIGLNILANGRLAPQLCPPTQLIGGLEKNNKQVPQGWMVSTKEVWVTYREAHVSVTTANNKLRLFIKIPIYDHAQRCTLF